MANVVRCKSTFAPRVCICCYWEQRYKLLLACHKALRLKLFPGKRADRRVVHIEEPSDDGVPLDLVEMMDA